MKIPDHILQDKSLTPWQRIILGIIATFSLHKGGCYASNKYFTGTYGMDKNTVSNAISKFQEAGLITISGTDRERVMEYRWEKFPEELKKNTKDMRGKIHHSWVKNSPSSGEKFPENGEKFTSEKGKIPQDGGKIHPAYNGKEMEEEMEEEMERNTATSKNSFSILKTGHEELVNYLLGKKRKEMVRLMPHMDAPDTAERFAEWWIGEGRGFTNAPWERKGVGTALPKWAAIEKPKSGNGRIAEIAREAWKRDLPEAELKLISGKVLRENMDESELRAFMIFTRRNIPAPHGTDVWNVFGRHFDNLITHMA